MEELKVHIQHVLWEFKNNKNTIETAKKISSVYGQGLLLIVKSMFCSNNISLRDEPRSGCLSDLNQDALRELLECNPHESTQELSLDCNTS